MLATRAAQSLRMVVRGAGCAGGIFGEGNMEDLGWRIWGGGFGEIFCVLLTL